MSPPIDYVVVSPIPKKAGDPWAATAKLFAGKFKPDHIYEYPDASEELLFCVCRWNARDGRKKDFLPLVWVRHADGQEGWLSRHYPEPRPLYGLDRLAVADPTAPILLVEGEKCVDAAWRFVRASVPMTWAGGSNAVGQADIEPLRGRDVNICPDADTAGSKALAVLIERLSALECNIKVVDIAALGRMAPDGTSRELPKQNWDIADAVEEWSDHDALRTAVKALLKPLPETAANEAGSADAAGDDATSDPLEGLVERATVDPGAAFAPEVLARLAELRRTNLSALETLREDLRRAGFKRLTVLDAAIANECGSGGPGSTQADILLRLADAAELFHSQDGTAFADVEVGGHRETWRVGSPGFKRWIKQLYFSETGGAPSTEATQSALGTIEARAIYEGPERIVAPRVGHTGDKLYLDLCDEDWRAVEIDTDGWRIIDRPPVRFIRSNGMKPLPTPLHGGSISALRRFVNVAKDDDFVLAAGWLFGALRFRGPYPILVLTGEQGSSKSTVAGFLRLLTDPNTAPLRTFPREERDLFINASNAHVLSYDNVSSLPPWMSDALCRIATGGGHAVRQNYTDQDEVLFDACKPIILNGIDDFVTRPDLADRSLGLTLEAIPSEHRLTEAELMADFKAARPGILGALLDGMVEGTRRLPELRLDRPPRMADFALWASACETAFWPAGTFMKAYDANRETAIGAVLDGDHVASAIELLMIGEETWDGTSSELLAELEKVLGKGHSSFEKKLAAEGIIRSKGWPASARALSGRLNRMATFLRQSGIDVRSDRTGKRRLIKITKVPKQGVDAPSFSGPDNAAEFASPASQASSTRESPDAARRNGTKFLDRNDDASVTQTNDGEATGGDGEPSCVTPTPLNDLGNDADDASDAKFPPRSVSEKMESVAWRGRV